ncbi:hypothetical protein RvY_01786-2 [Ramazzottius varieornatus]|uniref:MADF domain-containing protein n=1 Tax=Ramazzottius varieornatus TaxID=947166 RepID=A0A1D1UHM4_RAMVA|nr:hypothetical protein RvY_01786-2 [Ramazzottius varieornatus]
MDGQQPSSGKKAGGKRSVAGRPKVGKKKTPAETPAKKHRRSTTKRKWNEKDIADVITLVEKNRVFYDTSHVDYYKAKDKRLDIWEDMAKELKLEKTGEDVKKLWTNLRRNFGKKLKKHFGKKLKKHGTARQATIETWPHWDSMQFFRDYITPTEFSLSDGTTDDEGDNNDGTGDDTSLAANAIIDIPNPPSVQSSTGRHSPLSVH